MFAIRFRRSFLLTITILAGAALRGQVTGSGVSQDPFTGAGGRMMGGMTGGPVTSAPSNLNGFGLFSVSGFGGYATYPTFDPAASRYGSSGSSMTGAMASMGYGRVLGERSRFSVVYSPGMIVRPADLSRSRLNHSLGINLSQGVTARLSIGFGINASYAEFDQFAFSPARFSLVTSAPGSFDDLVNAINGGQYSNSQIASLLTGAPVLESAARASIYGNQALTASAQFRLNYKATPRLSVGVSVGANRYQSVGIKGDDLDRSATLPITNGLIGNLHANYAITPRTSIGANVGITRTESRYVGSSFITYAGNVSQRIGQRLFANLSGGSGNALQSKLKTNFGSRYLVSANLAFQASSSQTFIVQVGRTFVDSFGLGLRDTKSATGGWSYAPQGSNWTTTLSAGYQDSSLTSTRGLTGIIASGELNRKINQNFGLSGQFFYTRNNNTLGPAFGLSTQGEFERTGVRIVLSWFPKPIEY